MAEVDFERTLERLFGEAPSFPDSDSFVARIERRLDRGWTLRRVMIGAAGAIGGVIGASQLIMSRFVDRLESASEGSARIISAGWNQVAPNAGFFTALPSGSAVVWASLALALLAMGFVVTRLIDEF